MNKMAALMFVGIFALAYAGEAVRDQGGELRYEAELLKRRVQELQRARDEVAKMQKGGFINDKDAQAKILEIENATKQMQARQAELDARTRHEGDKAGAAQEDARMDLYRAEKVRMEAELKKQMLELDHARDEIARMAKAGNIGEDDARAKLAATEAQLKVTHARYAEQEARMRLEMDKAAVANRDDWRAAMQRTLDRKVSFEFVDTPFRDAIDFLGQLTKANIVVEPRFLDGIDRAITLKVADMPLNNAFSWICKSVGGEWELKDGAIFISKNDPDRGMKQLAQAAAAMDYRVPDGRRVPTSSKLHIKLSNGTEIETDGGLLTEVPELLNIILSDIHDPAKDGLLTFRIPEKGPMQIPEVTAVLSKVLPAVKMEIVPPNLLILYCDDYKVLRRASVVMRELIPPPMKPKMTEKRVVTVRGDEFGNRNIGAQAEPLPGPVANAMEQIAPGFKYTDMKRYQKDGPPYYELRGTDGQSRYTMRITEEGKVMEVQRSLEKQEKQQRVEDDARQIERAMEEKRRAVLDNERGWEERRRAVDAERAAEERLKRFPNVPGNDPARANPKVTPADPKATPQKKNVGEKDNF